MPRTSVMPIIWGVLTAYLFVTYFLTGNPFRLLFGALMMVPEAWMIYKMMES